MPSARGERRRAPRRVSLTTRILAVNIIALGLLAASLFYLDSYRRQLLAERFAGMRGQTEIAAEALSRAGPGASRALIAGIGRREHLRLRLFAGGPKGRPGRLVADSFALSGASFTLADPAREPALQSAARLIDRGMDALLDTPPLRDYAESPADAMPTRWPEVARARATHATIIAERYAPDRTPVITAATPVGADGTVLLALRNDPDITQNVRDARQTLAIVVAAALLISIALSLFLARTIVEPLRKLVRAAVRVRLGRDRAVVVPRLPERRDEIGLLARAISDMTAALRHRIDAVETFAADVAHEIKNPLASLRSALESLDKVEDGALRRQLAAIAAHDVRRIDRLVTEIADASRIDAELSRTTFEPVDLAALAEALIGARELRGANGGCRVSAGRHGAAPVVGGDPARLERVFENLLDNAVSFSPPHGVVTVSLTAEGGMVVAEVTDEGPGIAPEIRARVFERFHSARPSSEDFGRHSGLGLAIARTIIEAHDGTLTAREPHADAAGAGAGAWPGARLVIELPAWHDAGDPP